MKNEYELISDGYSKELNAMKKVLTKSKKFESHPQRIICESVHMLLVAKFGEFVRQMAIEAMGQYLINSHENLKFPKKLFEMMWKKLTEAEIEELKNENETGRTRYSIEQVKNLSEKTKNKINNLIEFTLGKNNDNSFILMLINTNDNMYYDVIKNLFKFCNIDDICSDICKYKEIKNYFQTYSDDKKIERLLKAELDDFIRQRNRIAHAIGQDDSLHPDLLIRKIKLFRIFARILTKVIHKNRSLVPR